MTVQTETTLTKKQTKERKHLGLPYMRYVVVDDWFDKIGEKSFTLWLKLLTKIDRIHTKDTVRYSQQALAKSLGMSKSTLIRQLQPLYEYGFIEYREYRKDGKVYQNIDVYEAPQNDETKMLEPLVKVRDWEDRTKEQFPFTKKGGRPKKEEDVSLASPKKMEAIQEEVAEELAPVEEVKEVVQAVEEVEEVEETTEFKANVHSVVCTEYKYFEATMEENGADLEVVKQWVNKVSGTVHYTQICYVFKQLAMFPEPIQKTSVFIMNTLDKAPTIHKPFTEAFSEKVEPVKETKTPAIPFFNWLDA
jgi:DNA-binding Lrp family transcriptional regulator